MPASNSLTLKLVDNEGITYIAATSIQLLWPADRGSYLLVEVGGTDQRREAHHGTAYVLNASGVVVEVIVLGQVAPQPAPIEPTEAEEDTTA